MRKEDLEVEQRSPRIERLRSMHSERHSGKDKVAKYRINQDVSQEWTAQVKGEKELSPLTDVECHKKRAWEPRKYEMNKVVEYLYTN